MTSSLTLREQLIAYTRRLEQSGADSPRLSAEILLAKALGCDRNELLKRLVAAPDTLVEESQRLAADQFVARRARGEPAAYILGVKEFYGRDFSVSPATLVPRPETELLVDLALSEMRRRPTEQSGQRVFADFGTGSGCIAVTLALTHPGWRGIAVDISKEALRTAQGNARRLDARNLVFMLADFAAPPLVPGSLELLASNPPYISEDEYAGLTHEVRDFEPKSALVPSRPQRSAISAGPLQKDCRQAGHDDAAGAPGASGCGFFSPVKASGLEDSLAIIEQAALLLKPGGLLLMETSAIRALPLLTALCGSDWREGGIHKDYAGLDRVLSARKR